jgi:uncharacterized protein (TIGR02270 family)
LSLSTKHAMASPRTSILFPALLARHAEDAAFYWSRYMEGTQSSLHDLRSLARFEFVLQGNLEGLRVAQQESCIVDAAGVLAQPGRAGWDAVWARVQKWKTADEAFVAGVLALEEAHALNHTKPPFSPNLGLLQDLACDQFDDSDGAGELDIARGLASAAAWLPWGTVKSIVFAWAQSEKPVLRRCALAACALQRLPAGDALVQWVHDPHALVRARALQAVGELGRDDLAPVLIEQLNTSAAHQQNRDVPDYWQAPYWAAWSLCLLGRSEGIASLSAWVTKQPGTRLSIDALAVLAQVMDPVQMSVSIHAMLQQPQQLRHALAAIRYSGDVRWIDTLLQLMHEHTQPEPIKQFFAEPACNLARLAADVFAHITGARIGEQLWMQAPQEPDEDAEGASYDHASSPSIPARRKQDPDDGLLWPDVPAIQSWWQAHRHSITSASPQASHYLAGLPLDAAHAKHMLADPQTTQLQRYHAALHLRCTQQSPTLFNTRAPLATQRQTAAQLEMAGMR